MRIISGNNKGKRLFAPKDMSVRPTSDKIKEAIFNMIGYIDEESTVLDIFAGTGNMGIEFLSRGAKSCYFVDSSHKSISFVKRNISDCKLESKSNIFVADYEKAIKMLGKQNLKFDYIFADPPYHLNCTKNIIELIFTNDLLEKDGLLIIECDKSEKMFENVEQNMLEYKEKIYGRTRIGLIKYLED